jgi:hypothetical protein
MGQTRGGAGGTAECGLNLIYIILYGGYDVDYVRII